MNETTFHMSGFVSFCDQKKTNKILQFYLPEHFKGEFKYQKKSIDVNQKEGIELECRSDDPENTRIYFEGTSQIKPNSKCFAGGDEIYCLNRVLPNPEIVTERSLYDLNFDLPEGFRVIFPDSNVSLNNGIAFQIARLNDPEVRKSNGFIVSYYFPQEFETEKMYQEYLERRLDEYRDWFGELAFNRVTVGVIRRDEAVGSISGSPAGNLLLFSRTALRDAPDLKWLKQIGFTKNLTVAFRKLVIAHESSHFWFSDKFNGKDGWMVEGIPNYLALYALRRDADEETGSALDFDSIMKFFKYMADKVPQEPIPNHPFGGENLYIKAYYQGALALMKIGDSIGHEALIDLIAQVYYKNFDPSFSDFDVYFRKHYPKQIGVWESAWNLAWNFKISDHRE